MLWCGQLSRPTFPFFVAVAEVSDATRPRDCVGNPRRNPAKRPYGLADDDELPLD
jgi:hypothetical protein